MPALYCDDNSSFLSVRTNVLLSPCMNITLLTLYACVCITVLTPFFSSSLSLPPREIDINSCNFFHIPIIHIRGRFFSLFPENKKTFSSSIRFNNTYAYAYACTCTQYAEINGSRLHTLSGEAELRKRTLNFRVVPDWISLWLIGRTEKKEDRNWPKSKTFFRSRSRSKEFFQYAVIGIYCIRGRRGENISVCVCRCMRRAETKEEFLWEKHFLLVNFLFSPFRNEKEIIYQTRCQRNASFRFLLHSKLRTYFKSLSLSLVNYSPEWKKCFRTKQSEKSVGSFNSFLSSPLFHLDFKKALPSCELWIFHPREEEEELEELFAFGFGPKTSQRLRLLFHHPNGKWLKWVSEWDA